MPIQLMNLGPPAPDFTPLASLGSNFVKGFDGARKNARDDRKLQLEEQAIADAKSAMTGIFGPDDSLASVATKGRAAGPSFGTDGGGKGLINSESGGNWQAQNDAVGAGGKVGHFGRLQFGQARIQDAINAGALPVGTTPDAFMKSPELQKSAENWHFQDINSFIRGKGYDKLVGQNVGGTPLTIGGMQAVAHLGGTGGLEKFIETGGRYNPADRNGTSLSMYLARHQGAGIAGSEGGGVPSTAVAGMPSEDPTRLRADADYYERTNPDAARQFRARADAAGGTRVTEADAPNMPDRSAVNAQGIFIPPGNSGAGTVQPNPTNPPAQSGAQGLSPRAQLILRTLANPYLPEGPRDSLKVLLAREMKTDQLRSVDGGMVTHMVDSAGRIRASIPKTTNPLDDEEKRGRIALQNKQLANEDLITFDVDGQKHVYNKRTKQTEAITPGREASAARAGLKPGDPGYQSFILTGKMPREDAGPLSATDKKAILEAEELVLSNRTAIDSLKQAKELSAKAYEGPTASLRGTVMGNFGNDAGKATMEYNNLITSTALAQLKATFGGAPTEGERKILLEIQGSASLPHDVRMKILDRAITMAEKRTAFNEQRAKELRSGDFYKSPEKRSQGDATPRQQQAQPGPQSRQPDTTQAKQAPDGNWYVPDPNRPGKYLQVQ